jgi:protocatechuate 3,4-dioxygenase alpha subunit
MGAESSGIPASSQTVGPYFRIGLEYLLDRTPTMTLETPRMIQICGRVLDRDGAPVPDAMLEFWSAATVSRDVEMDQEQADFPAGFRRAVTDANGAYFLAMERPSIEKQGAEVVHSVQAPHMLVLVYARGLLRHLISRVYLGDEPGNLNDSVLAMISEDRWHTLIARPDARRAGLYEWDVILQGPMETVFFAW